jgi:hypothetical protein
MNDQELEAFLKQFRSQTPSPLPDRVRRRHTYAIWWWSAAALIVAAIVLSRLSWTGSTPAAKPGTETPVIEAAAPGGPHTDQPVTLGPLSRLIREDPTQLDAALTASSRDLLPRIDRPDSALRLLARP